jgi:hypothetical protein
MSHLPDDLRAEIDTLSAHLVLLVREYVRELRPKSRMERKNVLLRFLDLTLVRVSRSINYVIAALRSWIKHLKEW